MSAQSFAEDAGAYLNMTTNPANRGSPAPVWNLTRDRNPNFTGRAEILEELRQRMVDGQRVQVIHGLGGIGKSQATVEYAYLFRNDYAIVWWIRADTPTSISAAYSRLAARLGKHLSVDAPPSLVRDAVNELLDKKDALIILDSAAGPETIRPFLLSNHSTHVLINSRNANARGFAERTAVNSPLQGTAADLIKIAMLRIDAAMRARNLRSLMTLQVHDELLFDVVPEEADEMQKLVKEEMESAAEFSVPIVADVGLGHNWRDIK